jgi:hypothetical protein
MVRFAAQNNSALRVENAFLIRSIQPTGRIDENGRPKAAI